MFEGLIDLVAGDALNFTRLTDRGWVVLSADLRAEGRTLHLDEFAIGPLHTKSFQIPVESLYVMRRELESGARKQGYNRLELHGVRTSGAHPNRPFHYTRRLS